MSTKDSIRLALTVKLASMGNTMGHLDTVLQFIGKEAGSPGVKTASSVSEMLSSLVNLPSSFLETAGDAAGHEVARLESTVIGANDQLEQKRKKLEQLRYTNEQLKRQYGV